MRPLWSVTGYLVGKGSGSSRSPEPQSYLFKALELSGSEITFDGRSCSGVTFQRETVVAAHYLPLAWRVTPAELGIEEREIEVVRTDCALPGFREYLHLKGNRLVIEIGGVFFYLEPVLLR